MRRQSAMKKRNEQFDEASSEQDISRFSGLDWAKPDPAIGEWSERGQGTTSAGMEGGELVVPSLSPKVRIQYQFEAFCKKVINGERCDYLRELLRRSEWESSFSDIPTVVLDKLYTLDDNPAEQFSFISMGIRSLSATTGSRNLSWHSALKVTASCCWPIPWN